MTEVETNAAVHVTRYNHVAMLCCLPNKYIIAAGRL